MTESKRREAYTYSGRTPLFAMNWSCRSDRPFRLAASSFVEEYCNKVRPLPGERGGRGAGCCCGCRGGGGAEEVCDLSILWSAFPALCVALIRSPDFESPHVCVIMCVVRCVSVLVVFL